MKTRSRAATAATAGVILAFAGMLPAHGADGGLNKINHLVVIYQENWSFDSLYGKFPGANGYARAGDPAQLKLDGSRYTTIPQAEDDNVSPAVPDTRIPANLPVKPFDLNQYLKPDAITGDIVHRFYQEQVQIDGGKNDRFFAASDNPGLVMSYFDASNMPEGKLAQQYVMADNFFQSAYGGSFLNHMWLVCACTPKWDSSAKAVPEAKRTVLDANGLPVNGKDGFITTAPDDFIINTSFTVNAPHPKPKAGAPDNTPLLVPNLTEANIGDRLTEKNLTWKWYSGGWDQALAGNADKTFQFHHQPFAFYKNYADGTPAKQEHLADELNFYKDLDANKLPSVSWIKPVGADNEHPGYSSLQQGQRHVSNLVQAIQNSSAWKDTAIVITYDEFGGRWDHVAPPRGDKWGPGNRVPAIIISPYAKKGYVDHTGYETVSILKTIENRWNLKALGTRDAAARDLSNAFDFSQSSDRASATIATSSSNGWIMPLAIVVVLILVGGAAVIMTRRPRA
ncbi:MAG: acid phosphatase [Candidatus Dormibacteria bacterium]